MSQRRGHFLDMPEDIPLGPEQAHKYRSLVARANFMAIDMPDVAFSIKEPCRFMANPTERSWSALIRLAEYLRWRQRYVQHFEVQDTPGYVNIYVDSDWAGEASSRKSTSGGVACLGDHPVKHWASTQNVVALSTGEAESYSIIKGSSVGLGLKSLLEDLGHRAKAKVLTDATTGKSLASRRGLGNVRHIEVSELWIQEAVQKERMEFVKINGSFNLADLFTKNVDAAALEKTVEGLGGLHCSGRHELAPQFSTIREDMRGEGANAKMGNKRGQTKHEIIKR